MSEPPHIPPTTNGAAAHADIEMKDEPAQAPITASPTPGALVDSTVSAPSQSQSRPHSPPTRPSPQPSNSTAAPPAMPTAHGSPARVYLNAKVTPHLLEGVRYLAVHEPEKPLEWLAEYLKRKSEEIEGS